MCGDYELETLLRFYLPKKYENFKISGPSYISILSQEERGATTPSRYTVHCTLYVYISAY